MLRIDQVHERRAEEFRLLGRRRFGRHRWASAQRRGEGITRLDWLQRERGFASFSPVADKNCTVPGFLDTWLHYAARLRLVSRRAARASRGLR
jgi:hypothetical protein